MKTFTFDELIAFGRANNASVGPDGMPWSFSIDGKPVTHENADCYLVNNQAVHRGQVFGIDRDGIVVILPPDLAEDLRQRFTYHSPQADQPARYQTLRDRAHRLAQEISFLTPRSREQSLALTHLETAIFFANAAIARHE